MLRAVRPWNQLARLPGRSSQPGFCALPGIGLSRVPSGIQGFRREERGVAVPSTKCGTPDPRLPAPSSLRSLTLGYCAHHQSPVWRALFPQRQPAPPAPDSSPTPNALPGFAGPPWFFFFPPVSRLLFLPPLSTPAPSQAFSHPSSSHFHYLAHYRPSLHRLSGGAVPRVVAVGARVARFLGVGSFGNSAPSGICILRGRDRAPRNLHLGTGYESPPPRLSPPAHSSLPKV